MTGKQKKKKKIIAEEREREDSSALPLLFRGKVTRNHEKEHLDPCGQNP